MAKYALILAVSPDELGLVAHGCQTALDLHRHGHETRVYLCGPATKLPATLVGRRSHPMNETLSRLCETDVLVGACAFCATAFGGTESCEDTDIELLGSTERHAPDAGALVDEQFELLTLG